LLALRGVDIGEADLYLLALEETVMVSPPEIRTTRPVGVSVVLLGPVMLPLGGFGGLVWLSCIPARSDTNLTHAGLFASGSVQR
jgi:hypothetical protein